MAEIIAVAIESAVLAPSLPVIRGADYGGALTNDFATHARLMRIVWPALSFTVLVG